MLPVPDIQWPSEFKELGPESDPRILLAGEALLAGIRFRVMAVRVRSAGRGPDFRSDIAEEEYDASLETMVECVEDLAESIVPPVIEMGGGEYLLWMFPCPVQ